GSFYQLLGKDRYLQPLVSSFKGVKPPRFPTIFETLVNAIACQQVTLDLGIALLNKLVEKYGKKFEDMNTTQYSFPEPEVLVNASEQDIKDVGFSHQKARTIIAVSKLFVNDRELFEDREAASNKEIINRLMEIKGIGRWSAEYVLLRGLGRIDTFPGDDVGAQKNLMLLMDLDHRPGYEEIRKLTKPWKPYAGFVYFHLLLDTLQKKNLL
ncbi:MAG: DNA-3-methyladenine glycosylase family protein, partial [Rhabdochlamydiaceae bacterium]